MAIDPVQQAFALLGSALLGAALGFIYDLMRLVRRMWRNKLLEGLLDLLFWCISLLGFLYYCVYASGGEVRFDLLCGAGAGGGLYFLLISPIFLRSAKFLGRKIALLFSLLTLPLRLIIAFIKKIIRNVKKLFLSRRKWYKIKKSIREMKKMSAQEMAHTTKKEGDRS